MSITIKNWYPHTFPIDSDEAGGQQTIELRITRFSVEQGKAFNQEYARIADPPHGRQIFRQPDGEEQRKHLRPEWVTSTAKGNEGARVKREVEVFVLDDDEIRRRRVQEMTPEMREVFLVQESVDRAAEYDFLVSSVRQYITVAPGQRVLFECEDGQVPIELRTGTDLVTAFGGHRPVLIRLASAIWAENFLTANQKKGWRSLHASRISSSAPPSAVPGPTRDETAAPAEPAASASTADVTALSAATPSGSTVN